MTKHPMPYFRYVLAVVTAAALFIAGAGFSPATATDLPEEKTAATAVEDTTVISETDAGAVGLTLPGTLTSRAQVSLSEVPEEYLEAIEETPLASTKLPYSAVSSYETDDGAQTLIRIDSAQASREYRFPLSLPVGATARFIEDGSILIKDAQGEIIGGYHVPWAVDANDAPVPTRFRLEDDTLIQTVDFTPQTAFPVVADPSLWQMGISVAVGGAVAAAVAVIPGVRLVSGPVGGCAAGAMNSMFDGSDFWGAFRGCLVGGALGGVYKTVLGTVSKVLRKFGFGR